MTTNARRIAAIEATGRYSLKVQWQDGGEAMVDMAGLLHRNDYFAALKHPALFNSVAVVGYGGGIEWANGIDYSADSLEALAAEQARMTPSELRAWKHAMTLSGSEMADIFGVSVSTIKSYLTGGTTIPVAVQIACQAMRKDPSILHARFRPRVAGRPRKATVDRAASG